VDGKITLDAWLCVLTVDGTNEPRVVRLFQRESCSCPARMSCYHITPALLAVGLSDSGTWHLLNLTQLQQATSCGQDVQTEVSAGRRRWYRACRWRRRGRGNGADCHHHGEPAAAAASAIFNWV